MTGGVAIAGLGHYAPDDIVTSAAIEARLGLADGWIARRTGIVERRYARDGQALTDLAAEAGEMALRNAGIARDQIVLTLLATSTPDHLLPPSAPLLAHTLGLTSSGGIDLAGACAGFLYALVLGDGFVRAHRAPVLVVAANILSRRINPADRATAALFADAAGAVVLVPSERADAGVRGMRLAASGGDYGLIQIPMGGSRRPFQAGAAIVDTRMVISDGRAVFAKAIGMMADSARAALCAAGTQADRIAHFIPHQANARMISGVAHQLGIADAATLSTVARFGNSSAATIPFTLSALASARCYQPGQQVLFTAAGAGLTGGAVVWGW